LNDRPRANGAHPVISTQEGSNAMKKALLTTLCVLAVGCTTRGQVNPDVMQIATTPLTCSSANECGLWWQRAQSWVSSHSTYKIEASNDSLIQTTGPDGGKRALAYQITKAANNDGTATIGFAAHCDSSLGCKPNPWEAGADFKEFVRSGTAITVPPQGTGGAGVSAPASQPLEAQPAQSIGTPGGEPVTQ
jgi:hypothetical protein